MENATQTQNTVAMVPADAVAFTTLQAFTVARRSKDQKAAGVSTAMVKAQAFAQQGVSTALMASLGVHRKANDALTRAQHIGALLQGEQVRFAHAIPQVLAVAELPDTYTLEVHADGTRHAKRADWLAVRDRLQGLVNDPATPGAKAKRAGKALALWNAIQDAADAKRAPAPALPGTTEGAQ